MPGLGSSSRLRGGPSFSLGDHGTTSAYCPGTSPPTAHPLARRIFLVDMTPFLRMSSLIGLLLLGLFSAVRAQPFAPAPRIGGETNRLLVVAPRAWRPALEEFVTFKRTLLPVEVRPLEDVLQEATGADDPEKLKRFLYAEWRERGLGYVLLVGDVDVMPVRYMVLDRVTPAAYDYAFYPSDLYYADLAKRDGTFEDWNAARDGFHAGYYGEVRGEKNKQDPVNFDQVDYLPEIAVGRWPVSTPEETSRVAAKTVACEKALLANTDEHLRRAALLAVSGWVDSRPMLDGCAARLTNTWQIEKRYYSNSGAAPAMPPPNPEQVRGLFNEGVGLVLHTGHGQPDAWEQCFSVADLDHLTNAARLPVVISVGCSTAYFAPLAPYGQYVDVDGREHAGTDSGEKFQAPPPPPAPYQRGRFNPTGLGEQMLKRNPNGAVAYIGCNTGSQPCALTLADGFVRALAEAREPRLGDCWAAAIRFYFEAEHLASLRPNDDWYPPSIFFQGMKFMVFGDPSLRLPASRP